METSTKKKRKLSHSQVTRWLQCQTRYQYEYTEHHKSAANAANIVGTAFHATLQYYGERILEDGTRISEEAARSYVRTKLRELLEAEGNEDLTAIQHDLLARCFVLLKAFYAKVAPIYTPSRAPERYFCIAIDDRLDFAGVVDAETARNGSTTIDWKTTKSLTRWDGSSWMADPDHLLQAHAYFLENAKTQRLTFVVFAFDPSKPFTECEVRSYVVPREGVEPVTGKPIDIDAYRALLLRVRDEIEEAETTGTFMASPSALCGGAGYMCGALPTCAIGQLWMARQQRECDDPAYISMTRKKTKACPGCGEPGKVRTSFRACGRGGFSQNYYSMICESCGVTWTLVQDANGLRIVRADEVENDEDAKELEAIIQDARAKRRDHLSS